MILFLLYLVLSVIILFTYAPSFFPVHRMGYFASTLERKKKSTTLRSLSFSQAQASCYFPWFFFLSTISLIDFQKKNLFPWFWNLVRNSLESEACPRFAHANEPVRVDRCMQDFQFLVFWAVHIGVPWFDWAIYPLGPANDK